MNKCLVSKLPVQEKPEWTAPHNEDGYNTTFRCIGQDIIFMTHNAKSDITLSGIEAKKFHAVLNDLDLIDKSLYIIADFDHVRCIAYKYKKDFLNFIFNWGRNIRLVVLYNIHPDIAIDIETFGAISTEQTRLLYAANYKDAMEKVIAYKTGRLSLSTVESSDEKLKNEFLAAVARISLLQMTNPHINIPPRENSLYPFFMAIKSLQNDLNARDKEHQLLLERLAIDKEEQLSKKIIQLNAEIALNKQMIRDLEQDRITLKSKTASQENELRRMTTAINKTTAVLQKLCSTIHMIDIDPELKTTILKQCQELIESERSEQPHDNIPLTVSDSEFLLKLQKSHPSLNQRELRLALLVKMNYDNSQIARALGISKRGSESIRYRMHKKMGLEKHQSIKTGLQEISSFL
ncbi:MAG: transcriptional regulator [Chlorobiaceae bacterium]|nr:transcriptional regulator [Chlorobiaceae bacterium]NTV16442.1 transcriptional regulator [Chlorobiaceae bacterium]